MSLARERKREACGHSRKTVKLILATILVSALILAFAYVPQANSKPNTTIKIDGDAGDWVGIAPIVTDTAGDEAANYDLLECYVTNDGSNLYFMIKVSGEIQHAEEGGPLPYGVGLDTDQNPATGEKTVSGGEELDIGVDYAVIGPFPGDSDVPGYFFLVVKTPGEGRSEEVGLFLSSFSNGVLEFGIPLSTIGYPHAINMVFFGKLVGTDFAPNQTPQPNDYVTYNVAPPLIKADGNVDDWIGVSPLAEATDPEGDVLAGYEDEDIVHCYVTNDRETLYVRIDVKGEVSGTTFLVCLDTDVNKETGLPDLEGLSLDIGMDYFAMSMPTDGFVLSLLFSSPKDMEPSIINAISSGRAGSTFEVAIPLGWIGSPNRIDIVFVATFGSATAYRMISWSSGETSKAVSFPDLAAPSNPYRMYPDPISFTVRFPDLAGPLRYEVYIPAPPPSTPPPPRPPPYVGGEVYSPNKLAILTPYLALIGLVSMVAVAVKRRRR